MFCLERHYWAEVESVKQKELSIGPIISTVTRLKGKSTTSFEKKNGIVYRVYHDMAH